MATTKTKNTKNIKKILIVYGFAIDSNCNIAIVARYQTIYSKYDTKLARIVRLRQELKKEEAEES